MRTSEAALAAIRNRPGGETLWLARWNEAWGAFHFVGGHRLDGESFRDCLTRELFEELGLSEGADFTVGTAPPVRFDYVGWSRRAQAETRYRIEMFPVDLREPDGRAIASRTMTRWLDRETMDRGRCVDGLPVSPTMGLLIAKAKWTETAP